MAEKSIESEEKKKTSHAGYVFIIFVLLVALGVLGFVYWQHQQDWNDTYSQMEQERDSLSVKLNGMLVAYDTMRTSNDSLKLQLDGEKTKIQDLLTQMRTKERLYYADMRKYEDEANTLRAIMRDYLRQIDSLNTLSQHLLAENKAVKKDLRTTRQEKQQLEKEKQELSSQVSKGAIIKVRDVEGQGLNARERDTKYARRTHKLKVCFTLNENAIAKPGLRFVYVSITDPNKKLLGNTDGETFKLTTGENTAFSAKREVDYQNQDLDMCVFYDTSNMHLIKGAYSINVYIDGTLSGTGQMVLK
jgi:hypothetical protein